MNFFKGKFFSHPGEVIEDETNLDNFKNDKVVTFGNITNPGTSKIKAIKSGLQVEFAKRTNIQIEKNHIEGVQTRGRIVMTPHGFIADDKKAIDKYKDQHKEHWLKLMKLTII